MDGMHFPLKKWAVRAIQSHIDTHYIEMMSMNHTTNFNHIMQIAEKIEQLENELKEFSDLQKKAYSARLQKSIIGLENRIERIKKMLYTN